MGSEVTVAREKTIATAPQNNYRSSVWNLLHDTAPEPRLFLVASRSLENLCAPEIVRYLRTKSISKAIQGRMLGSL